jgi:hypothetical protein
MHGLVRPGCQADTSDELLTEAFAALPWPVVGPHGEVVTQSGVIQRGRFRKAA